MGYVHKEMSYKTLKENMLQHVSIYWAQIKFVGNSIFHLPIIVKYFTFLEGLSNDGI
jgi:hypothetical protein